MASFNQIILLGNVVNLEVKTFTNGGKIVEASLATGKRWKDRNGDQHEETQWHRLVISGSLADTAEKYIHKGDSLFVQGEMTYRQWETREGEKRTSPEVRVLTLQLMPKQDKGQATQAVAPAPAPGPMPGFAGGEGSEDLPF
jgi:single-strand DNA-binding protein